jgi:hypothetical protein
MDIVSLTLSGIRVFVEETEINLKGNDGRLPLLTISGPNGSGKSAIVEALSALQSAGLLRTLAEETNPQLLTEYVDLLKQRLQNLAVHFPATITLNIEEAGVTGKVSLKIHDSTKGLEYELLSDGEPGGALLNGWSPKSPRNLIIAIPSTKYFDQTDVIFTQLRDVNSHRDQLKEQLDLGDIYPLLLDPPSALREAYRTTLEDWFYERIVPGKKRTLINNIANVFLNRLFPKVSIARFSATQKNGQIICLAKREDTTQLPPYDIRGLSSGEKYVYFLFSYISRYAGNILLAVLDEPENHLHETTLSVIYDIFFDSINRRPPFIKLLSELSETTGKLLPEGQVETLKSRIGERSLASSVLMLTHSKALIRRNMSLGRNLLLADGKIELLGDENTEDRLRAAGVSQVDERVLIVEGKTDFNLMTAFLGSLAEIRPLGGKGAVCEAFEGFMHLDPHRRHPGYAFLLDGDSGLDYRYTDLKTKYEERWTRHVILLARTELENYLLEPAIFRAAMLRLLDKEDFARHDHLLSEETLEQLLRRAADKTREDRQQKFLADAVKRQLQKSFPAPKAKDLPLTKASFVQKVEKIYSEVDVSIFSAAMETVFDESTTRFSDAEWNVHWKARCQGKAALASACGEIAKSIAIPGLHSDLIRYQVIKASSTVSGIELGNIVSQIRTALDIPAASPRPQKSAESPEKKKRRARNSQAK